MRSRTIPSPNGRLVLTPRDIRTAAIAYLHRAVTEDHLMPWCGYRSGPRFRARARMLFDHQVLRRSFVATGAYANKTVYSLGLGGVDIVASELGISSSDVRRLVTLDPARISLEHSLLLADIRLSVEASLTAADAEAVRYLPEVAARDEYTLIESGRESHRVFKPDAYVAFRFGGNQHAAFIEGDRSTASSSKIREVLGHYQTYQRQVFTEVYGHDRFAVLFITTGGERRLANLVSLADSRSLPAVYFTTAERFFEDGLLAPIWTVAGEPRLVAFWQREVRNATL